MQYLRSIISLVLTLLFLTTLVAAVAQPQKSVIISFPSDTPYSVIEQAKEAVLNAGGVITHEYKIIKGFACTASAKAFEMVNALNTNYLPNIEEDQVISIAGSA